jgi:hypothetical protein
MYGTDESDAKARSMLLAAPTCLFKASSIWRLAASAGKDTRKFKGSGPRAQGPILIMHACRASSVGRPPAPDSIMVAALLTRFFTLVTYAYYSPLCRLRLKRNRQLAKPHSVRQINDIKPLAVPMMRTAIGILKSGYDSNLACKDIL